MQIKTTFLGVALATTIAIALPLSAKAQDEVPAGQSQNFGPRKGAQAAQPQVPPAETVAKHGAWEVQCAAAPKDANGQEVGGRACGMIQTAKNAKNPNVGMSVIVSRIKRGDQASVIMRVLAPIGVYLPTGIPIEIDGAALQNRLQFTRCMPRICEGFGEASPESLKKFEKGGKATFYLYDKPGNGYPLEISLDGFAAALKELVKL